MPSDVTIPDLDWCEQHQFHDALEPYFLDKNFYLEYLTKRLNDCDEDSKAQLQRYKDSYAEIWDEPLTDIQNWSENEWSEQLTSCIQEFFGFSATFTGLRGMDFNRFVCETCKRSVPDCFMFHGAPDILISKSSHIINAEASIDYSSLSSDDECVVENCLQRPGIKNDASNLPEKLGELLAASHFLLVCKFIRRIIKGKDLRSVTINGLLVDKIAGVIRCELKGNVVQPIEKDEGSLKLTIYNGFGRQLDSKSLCHHIRKVYQ